MTVIKAAIVGHDTQRTICAGEQIAFDADVYPHFDDGLYEWEVDGVLQQTSSDPSFRWSFPECKTTGTDEITRVQLYYRVPSEDIRCAAKRRQSGEVVDDVAEFVVIEPKIDAQVAFTDSLDFVDLEGDTICEDENLKLIPDVCPLREDYACAWSFAGLSSSEKEWTILRTDLAGVGPGVYEAELTVTGDERSCSVRRTITVGHAHIEVPKDQLVVQVGTIEDARAYTYPSDLSVRWTLGGAKATFVVDDGVGSPGKIVDGTESLAPQVGPVPDDAKDAINDVPLPGPKIEGMIPPTIELESTDNPAQICFLEEGDVELSLFCGPDPGSSLTQFVGIKAKPLEMSVKENTTNKPDRVCTGEVVRLTFDINLDREGPPPWREIPRDIKEQRYVIRCPGVIIKAQAPGFTTKILQKQSGKSHYATVQRKGSNKKTGRFTLTVDVKHQGTGEHTGHRERNRTDEKGNVC